MPIKRSELLKKVTAAKPKKIPPEQWKKLGDTIMEWAQSDSGSNELSAIFPSVYGTEDEAVQDAFWAELQKRINKAFGG